METINVAPVKTTISLKKFQKVDSWSNAMPSESFIIDFSKIPKYFNYDFIIVNQR